MSYLDRKDRRIFRKIANKILDYVNNDISIKLSREEMILIQRLKVIYSVDYTLILETWMNTFPDMTEEEALNTMRYLLEENKNN